MDVKQGGLNLYTALYILYMYVTFVCANVHLQSTEILSAMPVHIENIFNKIIGAIDSTIIWP